MVGHYNHGVPTAADLENNSNQKKYTVNRKPGGLVIPRSLCALMAIGALLLAVLVGLIVFFLVPRCTDASLPQASDSRQPGEFRISDDGLPIPSTMTDGLTSTYSTKPNSVDERLPTSIEPTHYRIQIRPYLYNLTFHGAVSITLNIKEETDRIIFNVKNINIDKQSVKVKSVKSDKPLTIKSQDFIKGDRYKVVLEESLNKNVIYTLELMYIGFLNNHLQGFYRSEYDENSDGIHRFLASTQFSPTDARRAFPCFDEPSFKATFSVIIGRSSNMSSLANMPLEKSDIDPNDRNLVWDYYKTTPKMSTYLVAFTVNDFQGYGSSDRLIKIWSRRSLSIQARYAAELAPKILRYYESYFNISFPLPKIDIVAVPDFGYKAMENWGLITFREPALLLDTNEVDVSSKRLISTVLSHEMAHQWFGNLVTPKWWDDLWLKEGFATYLQYLGTDFAEPTWQINNEFIFSETATAVSFDAFESARPISFKVQNNEQIKESFDSFSYNKGAAIIRMMRYFLGEKSFKKGLIDFLDKYKYGNADKNQLFEVLTEEAHKSGFLDKSITVKDVMDSWSNQPGFPVVTAIRDVANKKLILSQKRFFFTSTNNDNSTWWIPISIVTDLNPDFNDTSPKVWLKNEPMVTINLEARDFYLVNTFQTGYYIVNYDEANWRALTERIMNLPALIRAQLISDSMDLARANLLDYDIPLKMIQLMALRDSDIMYVPTQVAFQKLEYLHDMLASTPIFGLFDTFQSTIFKQTYAGVSADRDYYADNYLLQQIRKTVLKWACQKADSECAITAHRMFRNWMENKNPVPPNIRNVVYCTAIRQGSEAEWEFAFNKYLGESSVTEKQDLLDALGCTTRKWLLSRYLDYLVRNDSSIKIQDASRVFKSVSSNSIASTMAFDFLRSHWQELLAHYGEGFGFLSKMVKTLPKFMNTEYQLSELVRFRNEVKNNLSTAGQAFDVAIQQVRANVEWMKKNYHSVENWLTVHQEHFHL